MQVGSILKDVEKILQKLKFQPDTKVDTLQIRAYKKLTDALENLNQEPTKKQVVQQFDEKTK